jgi:hypothetical protein
MVRHAERKALQIHNLYVVVIKGTKNLFHSLYIHTVVTPWRHWSAPLCGKQETHIHDISNTFPQLFVKHVKGKSLKSEGIGMPRDKK